MITPQLLPAFMLAMIVGAGVFAFFLSGAGGDPDSVDPQIASTAGLIGMIVFMVMFLGIQSYTERMDVKRRVQLLRGGAPRRSRTSKSIHKDRIIQQSSELRRRLTNRFTKMMGVSGTKMPEIRLLLLRAGFVGDRALMIFLVLKAIMPFAGLFAGMSYMYNYFNGTYSITLEGVLAMGTNDLVMFGAGSIAGALVGSMAIEEALKKIADKRAQKIWDDLPDTLDLMVIYTETGATLDTALPRIVDEIKENSEALALELTILRTELRLQAERTLAYDNFSKRVELPAIKSFCSIIKQSERMGTPVTQGLAKLADELRRERMLMAERRAARIPTLITFPLMLCIMPAMFIVVLGPVVIRAGAAMRSMGL